MKKKIATLVSFVMIISLIVPIKSFANSKINGYELSGVSNNKDEDSDFLLYSYMADYYLENENIVNATEKAFSGTTFSPSKTIFDAGEKAELDKAAKSWKQYMSILEIADKPSSVLDLPFEKKDTYSGLLFSVLECSNDSTFIKNMDLSGAKITSKLYELLKQMMQTEYAIEPFEKYDIPYDLSILSEKEWEEFANLTEEIVTREFGYTGEILDSMGDLLTAADNIKTVDEWCTFVSNCILLNQLNEGTKRVITEMYETCPEDNLALRAALNDCLDIARANELDLVAQLSTYLEGEMTKKAVQELVDDYYSGLKKEAMALNPYTGLLWIAYNGSKLATNAVFHSQDISEKYCKMQAILEIRELAYQAYLTIKSDYEGDRCEANAQSLMSAINIMYSCIREDCNCAKSYVDTVDTSFCEIIKRLFGKSNGPQVVQEIQKIQSNAESISFRSRLEWIQELKTDYPEEYVKYSSLLPNSVYLEQSNLTIEVGQEVILTADSAGDVTWTSNKPKIVSVDKNGKIVGIKSGKAVIEARSGSVSATCTVTVNKPSVKLSKSNLIIVAGNSVTLKAVVKGKSNKITWKSSNKNVAIVSSSGKITGKNAGTATITASANGVNASCKVTVKDQKTKTQKIVITKLQGNKIEYYCSVEGANIFWEYDAPYPMGTGEKNSIVISSHAEYWVINPKSINEEYLFGTGRLTYNKRSIKSFKKDFRNYKNFRVKSKDGKKYYKGLPVKITIENNKVVKIVQEREG